MPNNDIRILIGKNIRHYRKANNLTQEQLAEKVGVSTSFCANIERGGRSMSIQVLTKFAQALRVSVDSLVLEPNEMENSHAENIRSLLARSNEQVSALAEDIVRLLVTRESE